MQNNEISAAASSIECTSKPSHVISICGDSAVGKGTLIDKINNDEPGIRKRFGITGSVGFYALNRQRTRSEETVYIRGLGNMLASTFDTLVFRWQYDDHKTIEKLVKTFPNARHQVLLLWAPWKEHQVRREKTHNKPTKAKSMWNRKILPLFGSRSVFGIPVELVDVSTPTYDSIDYPSV